MKFEFGIHTDKKDQLITAVNKGETGDAIQVEKILSSCENNDERKELANIVLPDGNPIIFVPLQRHNQEIFKLLKDAGADLNAINEKTKLSILDIAAMYSDENTARELTYMKIPIRKDIIYPPSFRARKANKDGVAKIFEKYEKHMRNGSSSPPQVEKVHPNYKPTNRGRKMMS